MATKKKPSRAAPAAHTAVDHGESKFKVLRNVTVPTLKMELESPIYIKAMGPHFKGKDQKPVKDPDTGEMKTPKPVDILTVTDIESGELRQLVLGAALLSILDEGYPENAYVDKAFRVIKHDKSPGKRYFTYSVDEVDA